MNIDLSSFIPSYPIPDDEEFMKKMVVKEELRELLSDPTMKNTDTPFFYNGQVAIGRWMAPWTNNRRLLIFHDPGTGKTRTSISYMLMWMQYSNHKRALVISNNETSLKAFADEVVVYKQKDKELNERKWVIGKKSHGKTIASTHIVKTTGFDRKTIAIVGRIAKERGYEEYLPHIYENYSRLVTMTYEDAEDMDMSELYDAYVGMRDEIRNIYGSHVITIDEVHVFRQGPSDNKQSYAALIFLLDALRDISPIVIMTATPIVDTWRDLMSVIGMLYGPSERVEIEEDVRDVERGDLSIEEVVSKWGRGIVSYRSSAGIVPAKMPLPGYRSDFRLVTNGGEEIPLNDNMYPVFMSYYQTTFTSSYEVKGAKPASLDPTSINAVSEEAGIYSWRKYYDFVPPAIEREDGSVEFMSMDDLIVEDQGRYVPSRVSYLNGGQDPVFEVIWNEDNTYSKERGLGKYACKIAELIRLLRDDPTLQGKAGYAHSIWVEYGTKPIAAALNMNGWEQYTGSGEVSASKKPKFAVIHGQDLSSTKINNIIDVYNRDENQGGNILRLIVGSRKSGISLSFINAEFFIELSSTFNKSVHIQSEGRVLRASSLEWKNKNERVVYTLSMVALPYLDETSDDPGILEYKDDISDGIIRDIDYYAIDDAGEALPASPYTIEMRLYYLAQEKYDVSQVALNTLKDISIEENYKRYRHLPSDKISYNLIYADTVIDRLKKATIDIISSRWAVRFDPNDMTQAKAMASLVSEHTLALSPYGMPAPIRDIGDVISAYRGSRSSTPLSLIYNDTFFITEDMRTYNARTVHTGIDILRESPTTEYDFYHHLSSLAPTNVKMFLLEQSLSRDPNIVDSSDMKIIDSRKGMILSLYRQMWDIFSPSVLFHILWYTIRNGSYVSKLGITADPLGRSRTLPYDLTTKTSISIWRYETNTDTESIYLSNLARKIYDTEIEVINNMKRQNYKYYVHFSLSDGTIRIRDVNLADLRKSKFYLSNDPHVQDFISKIVTTRSDSIDRDIYYGAKEKGILMIR